MDDHDLLLTFKAEVSTKLDRVISDVKDLKDNTAARVTALEDEKVNKSEFEDFRTTISREIEKQGKKLEKVYSWVLLGLGALGVIEFGLQIYTNYFKK